MLKNKVLVKGACACCGDTQIFELCEYQDTIDDMAKLTFAEYLDYKSININFCSNCGYINNDLSQFIGSYVKDVVDTNEYKEKVNDSFMGQYKNLYGEYYKKFNCGKYEAFAMLYESNNKINFDYIKILNAIYEIKYSIRSAYFEDRCDIENNQDEKRYDEFISDISKQMEDLNKKTISALIKLQPDNIYSKILIAQIFARNGRVDLAREIANNYSEKYQIDEELREFFKEITSEIETI